MSIHFTKYPLATLIQVSHLHFVVNCLSAVRMTFIPSMRCSKSASLPCDSVRQRSEARVTSRKPKLPCTARCSVGACLILALSGPRARPLMTKFLQNTSRLKVHFKLYGDRRADHLRYFPPKGEQVVQKIKWITVFVLSLFPA